MSNRTPRALDFCVAYLLVHGDKLTYPVAELFSIRENGLQPTNEDAVAGFLMCKSARHGSNRNGRYCFDLLNYGGNCNM
jgi:hypothetical protein